MNTKRKLLALAALLGSTLPAAAQGLSLQGQLQGERREEGLSIGIWTVSPAGQTGQLVAAAPVSASGAWKVVLSTPPAGAQPLSPNLGWPGLLPPVQLSGTPRGQEVRAYAFVDSDGNGQPDSASATLREVALRDGNRSLFLVWVEQPVTVSAERGYQASLSAGWNALQLGLGQQITLEPYQGRPLQLRVSP